MANEQQPAPQGQQRQIQLKMPDDVLKGFYANMMRVLHSREEFTMDFLSIVPGEGVGVVGARVKISPGHMKRLVKALQENLEKYEKAFGKIAEADAPNNEIGFQG